MKIFQNTNEVAVKAGAMTSLILLVFFLIVIAFDQIFRGSMEELELSISLCFTFCAVLGFVCFKSHDPSHIISIGDGEIVYKRHGETLATRNLENYIGFKKYYFFHTNRVLFKNEDDLIIVGFSDLMVNQIRYYLDELKLYRQSDSKL